MKNCPFCGTPALIKNNKKLMCPNCGIIEQEEKKEDKREEPSYIG